MVNWTRYFNSDIVPNPHKNTQVEEGSHLLFEQEYTEG